MSDIQNVSRRSFIKNMGLASGGLILASNYTLFSMDSQELSQGEFNPNLFVELHPDGRLLITVSRSEMGNGVRTSLSSVIADEMEADWTKVSIIQAVGDKKYGDQNTDGSRSVTYLYETMRKMGAMSRMMLVSAAAKTWKVPESECRADNHFIVHSSGKKIAYGDLVALAKTMDVPSTITYKNPKDFKFIGKGLKSIDIKSFVNGSAIYGIDKRLPNMKFAAIARCPVTFGTPKSYDKTAALKIPGVENVIELPKIDRPFGPLGGIAVIANSSWAAFKGKEVLDIVWDYGKNQGYDSQAYMAELVKTVHKDAKVEKEVGDVNKAFEQAAKIIESSFELPHLAHAPMEVPTAVAWVQGDSCQVWAPTQSPQTARDEVVSFLGVDKEKVILNVTFLGGGFGRKSKPDFIVEAVMVSKAINAAVQVVWSREDDIKHGYYHTVSAQYLKASLDSQGRVTGWLHRSAFPSITSTFTPGTEYPAPWEASSAANLPFDIQNIKIESGKAPAMVRIGWMRSVIHILHGFSINVFADELAYAAKQDPLTFRLNLIGEDRIENSKNPIKFNTARLKNVLSRAAKNANWGKPLPKGHAHGLAVHYSFNSYVASVVEVSLVEGLVKTHQIHTVIDCGLAVNKDTITSQLEGAAVFGLSLAYYGKITAKEGAIEQNSFSDYRMLRMNETPKVKVEIVESADTPTGVGEPGVPVIAAALVNALFKLTGKRYYKLPLSDYGLV